MVLILCINNVDCIDTRKGYFVPLFAFSPFPCFLDWKSFLVTWNNSKQALQPDHKPSLSWCSMSFSVCGGHPTCQLRKAAYYGVFVLIYLAGRPIPLGNWSRFCHLCRLKSCWAVTSPHLLILNFSGVNHQLFSKITLQIQFLHVIPSRTNYVSSRMSDIFNPLKWFRDQMDWWQRGPSSWEGAFLLPFSVTLPENQGLCVPTDLWIFCEKPP